MTCFACADRSHYPGQYAVLLKVLKIHSKCQKTAMMSPKKGNRNKSVQCMPGLNQAVCARNQSWAFRSLSDSFDLIRAINNFRITHSLSAINISRSLMSTACAHMRDITASEESINNDCGLHSWSSCCYPSDHSNVILQCVIIESKSSDRLP